MSTNGRKRKTATSTSDPAGGPTKKPRGTEQNKRKKPAQEDRAPEWPEYFNSVCMTLLLYLAVSD